MHFVGRLLILVLKTVTQKLKMIRIYIHQ